LLPLKTRALDVLTGNAVEYRIVKRKKRKQKRVYQQKMWNAATFYGKEAEKSYKAKAYFCALVARGCETGSLTSHL
jgi:hypothetical protein